MATTQVPSPVGPPPAVTPPATPPAVPGTPPPPPIVERPDRPERVDVPPPASAPPTAPPVAPGQRGKFVVLNFDNADVETVVQAAAEIAGFNYVLGPGVAGKKVTVQTSGRIPQEDVFGVMLAILEVHGVTAVKSGNLYKIVVMEGARERAIPTIIGGAPDPTRVSDEVITQIVPMRFASVTDVSNLIRPLMSSRGALIAHRETNILILTDTASNIRRLLDIVRLVDVEVTLEELQIVPLRYADAAELEAILNRLFQTGRVRTGAPAGVPAAPPPVPAAPGVPRPPTVPGAPATVDAGGPERPPLIIASRRTNSLIVHARRHELELIKKLIAQLDIDIYRGRRVFIYYAENAKAKDLTATLNAIYGGKETLPTGVPAPTTTRRPGEPVPPPPPPPTAAPGGPVGAQPGAEAGPEGQVRFIADETTNSVIVATFPHIWPEVETTIRQLDKMPRQVLIEVLVAEITLNDITSLGIDWALQEGRFRFGQQSLAGAAAPPPAAPFGPFSTAAGLASGFTAFTFASDRFFALLNALASESRINVLSNPHVLTAENKKAVINVSESVPIITSQQAPVGGTTTPAQGQTIVTTGTQTVEYRDAGVILTVTPRIGERGTVALDVKQEVNAIGTRPGVGGSPTFIKREAETSVVLVNNQTLVLGGLIQNRGRSTTTGIPWLKDIPILGYLFGSKSREIEKTELILMITPRVIGTALDAAKLTEQMRRSTPELEQSIKRAPRQPSPLPPPPPPPAPPSEAPPGSPAPPREGAPPPPPPVLPAPPPARQ
ncbi:MAG: type II secretion system secretin GspD [Candidatus Rokubacteria bacterium]|nr:type II secretion system secretin GspD [Candidatus Rokubacteria bacterium]